MTKPEFINPLAKAPFKARYGNFIGGEWVAAASGKTFDNVSPITGGKICEVARSEAADIELALDAAHTAKDAWGRTSATERSTILLKIADRMEANLEILASAETWDNGKPIRETMAADIPLAIDHLRYFAGCIRAQEGSISQIDNDTVAYHFHEPLGVVGQIIPWNFPILMAVWKLAPALAAGNCVVLKPAEQTPASILVLMELIADLVPPGVINVVNGYGLEAGKPLAQSKRVAKIAFTGETTTGKLIMQYASENLIPVTLELGGKSPNIFFADVAREDDAFLDKALEGFVMFALNQGEVCTCPSRALVQESMYDRFMEKALKRVGQITQGSPLDAATMIGAQASEEQLDKIMGYIQIGKDEGRRAADRRRPRADAQRSCRRLLRAADRVPRPEQDAHLPGGDLRPGAGGDHLQGRGGGARDRQRHPLRPRRRRVDPRRQPLLPLRPRHPGRAGVGQLLPRLSGARGVRRLQAVWRRPRDPQDDARPLPADQEHAGQLQRQGARVLLAFGRREACILGRHPGRSEAESRGRTSRRKLKACWETERLAPALRCFAAPAGVTG